MGEIPQHSEKIHDGCLNDSASISFVVVQWDMKEWIAARL